MAVILKLFPNMFSPTSKPLLTYSLKRHWKLLAAGYAIKAMGAPKPVIGVSKKKKLNVETNAAILCSRLCGGNIYKEGEDPVLGPDSAYPDWLWKLHIDKTPVPFEDLSEDDMNYWRRLRKMTEKQNATLRSIKKF